MYFALDIDIYIFQKFTCLYVCYFLQNITVHFLFILLVTCEHNPKETNKELLYIQWVLRYSPCAEEYKIVEDDHVMVYFDLIL